MKLIINKPALKRCKWGLDTFSWKRKRGFACVSLLMALCLVLNIFISSYRHRHHGKCAELCAVLGSRKSRCGEACPWRADTCLGVKYRSANCSSAIEWVGVFGAGVCAYWYSTCNRHARTYTFTHTHMHARTHIHFYALTHACTHAHTLLRTHTCMHARTHAHTRLCMHIHVYACTYTFM